MIELLEFAERQQRRVQEMNQNQVGWVVLIGAMAMLFINVSDGVSDLQNWHSATTPAFVALVLKQIGGAALFATGGKMTSQFGKGDQP